MPSWSADFLMEMQVVAHHRRNDARRAIGGRGHDAAAGGILLVDGHGIDGQPVIGEQRIGPVGGVSSCSLSWIWRARRAHLQAAGHDAVLDRPRSMQAFIASQMRRARRPALRAT
jgi:hypothetical protein